MGGRIANVVVGLPHSKWSNDMATSPVTVKKSAPSQTGSLEPLRSLRGEMDRLFDRFSRGFGLPSLEPFWSSEVEFETPAVDLTEDDKAFTITAELPGIDEKEIDVTVSGGMLVIKGEKKQEKEEKNKNYYVSERSYGAFQRSFSLPEGVDQDKIAADFSRGVLTVTLPKSADAQKAQKKIEVKTA
jgi:HSP20 family protein